MGEVARADRAMQNPSKAQEEAGEAHSEDEFSLKMRVVNLL